MQVMEVTKEFLACVQAQVYVHICKSKLDLRLYLHTYMKIAALKSYKHVYECTKGGCYLWGGERCVYVTCI